MGPATVPPQFLFFELSAQPAMAANTAAAQMEMALAPRHLGILRERGDTLAGCLVVGCGGAAVGYDS